MKKYCVEITRESEEKMCHHFEFDGKPTVDDVLKIVMSLDCGYDDNYGKIEFYEVFALKEKV